MPGQTLRCAALWGALSQINDIPVTGRDQEVVAVEPEGQKFFVRIFLSGHASLESPLWTWWWNSTPPGPAPGGGGGLPSWGLLETENFTDTGRWGREPNFGNDPSRNSRMWLPQCPGNDVINNIWDE